MSEPGAPLEAHYSPFKLAGWLAISGGFAALAGFFLAVAAESGDGLMLAAMLLGIVLFGLASIGFLRCLIDRRVQVRIDAKGLYVRAHSDTVIPLRSLSGAAVRGNRVIFGLTKPEKFPIRSRWRRFIYRINGSEAGPFFGNLWIWTSLLDCTGRDILNAVHDFRVPTPFEQELRAKGASAKSDIVPVRL